MANPETEKLRGDISDILQIYSKLSESPQGCSIEQLEQFVAQILQAGKDAGGAFVDRDSLRIIPAQTASQNDSYWADGIGVTWERDAPTFGLFYKAGFRKFKEIEL